MTTTITPSLEEVIPDIGQVVKVDEAVVASETLSSYPQIKSSYILTKYYAAELPSGAHILSANSYSTSLWTRTAKVVVSLPDGTTKNYFLKCATGDNGKVMMNGEFESMTAIHSVLPTFCPKPLVWGTYSGTPSTYFFLCDFHEMGQSPPEPVEFCAALAELHAKGTSPNGKFGFHITTCNGTVPQENSWKDTWEEFFAAGFKHMLSLNESVNGHDDRLEELSKPYFDTVIPRLLKPLESHGRSIKPSLLHGDLWYGNSATVIETGKPMVYDACAFYGHHEYELGNWRPIWNKFDRRYLMNYTKNFPISEPEEDFDDRNALYAIRFNLHASILFPRSSKLRSMSVDRTVSMLDPMLRVITEMEKLVKKFCGSDGH